VTEPFLVRSVTPSDYADIAGLLGEVDELHRANAPWLFQKPVREPWSREFFDRLLASGDAAMLVADAERQLVGVATVMMRRAPDFSVFINQSWGVLDNIAVARAWRRRGAGRALTRAAEQWALARGAKWLELGVYEFNAEARAFYQALGYSPVSTKLRKPLQDP
jgi:ribosomal protein S18 acetylase RimI-like enzyme